MTIAEAARLVLLERGETTVSWGDTYLLHEINKRAGRRPRGPKTERYVLSALDRSPLFEKKYFTAHVPGRHGWRKTLVRSFQLKWVK